MDKRHFVETAPIYYALAICFFFRGRRNIAYREQIEEEFTNPERALGPYNNLQNEIIFQKAIEWLTESGMIEPLLDDFGPPIYRSTDSFSERFQELTKDKTLPFYKYEEIQQPRHWLDSALAKLNHTFDELGITEADFDNPDDEWNPLPLNRDSPQLQTAIKALDEVVEQVRGDNGYNATVPEERNYVLNALTNVSKTLKESTSTSLQYIKVFALEPLAMLLRRFEGAAIAVAAMAAKDALIEFLKQLGVKMLEAIFK